VTSHGLTAEARAVLDHAPCALLQTSVDGTLRRVNATFCRWLDRAEEELVARLRFQDLLTMGGRIFHQTHWIPLLQMQGSISEVKLAVLRRDGTAIPMVVNAIRHLHEGVEVHEIAAYVARDRDQYERELVLARQRLERMVEESARLEAEAKDRLLLAEQMMGIVSHDLRNPLSVIAMGTSLLAEAELPELHRRTLGRIQRSTQRANRLIADLLDFTQARLGAGLPIVVAAIDPHDVVAQALDELRPVHPTRALVHERIGQGDCDADANRLVQLVGNLVANAVTYGDADTPITVTSSIAETTWSIAVHNHGPVIPEELRAQVFRPMARGSHAPNEQRSVGLGLFIVREIAIAHGGSVDVRSTATEGTVFTTVFPRRSADSSA
jgi:sigma-B regulation protein RsbU (phosphoserine phosphatase)